MFIIYTTANTSRVYIVPERLMSLPLVSDPHGLGPNAGNILKPSPALCLYGGPCQVGAGQQ